MNVIKKLFTKDTKPKERVLYAITGGTYMGHSVVFINPTAHPKNGIYAAIAIGGKDMDGGMEAMDIPEDAVTEGLKKGILDKIKKIPPELYELCKAEYAERVRRNMEKFNKEVGLDESAS